MKSISSIILSATLVTSYSMASNNFTTNSAISTSYVYVNVSDILINPSPTLQFAYPLHNGEIGYCNCTSLRNKIIEQNILAKLNSTENQYTKNLLDYGYIRKLQNCNQEPITTLNPVSIVPPTKNNEIRSNALSSMHNSRPSSSMKINEPFSLLAGCIEKSTTNQL